MDVDLIFKIAAVGILVAVLNQLLVRSLMEPGPRTSVGHSVWINGASVQ